ncbi:MAG: hypothetical protein HY296_01205 [Thaumarchaeota archaeon]|nr:hypothetical protein [Nitrososphaerota archaeon]
MTTRATVQSNGGGQVATVVNGDPNYKARTTRRAVGLLTDAARAEFGLLTLEQDVDVPIGSGFGASAASAISAVFAVAEVVGIRKSKRALALFAHKAEIIEQTGLGTVSVTYDATGAGAITKGGEPGVAEFVNVPFPEGSRIVTAYLAPYDKRDALSSEKICRRINRLGSQSLRRFLDDPSLDSLASEGERFSEGLGLESSEVKKLEAIAKKAGADHASQNMIGHSVHAVADEDSWLKVSAALSELGAPARIGVYRVGSKRAGLMKVSRR